MNAIQQTLATGQFIDASSLAGISTSIANIASLQNLQLSKNIERQFAMSMRAWGDYAKSLPKTPSGLDLARVYSSGESALSIASGVAAIGGRATASEIARPWEGAAADLRSEMFGKLGAIDEGLPTKLEGAWDRIQRPGPDAVSQAANSLIELIDWFLRSSASDDVVLAWHIDSSRPETELHEGRPTRALRISYIMRNRSSDTGVVIAYSRTLLMILEELQGLKHSVSDQNLTAIRRLIPGVEAVLTFILT